VSGQGQDRHFNNLLAAQAHVTDQLPAYALGALEPTETEIVVRHLQSCSACRAELESYQAVTALLPYAAQIHAVPVRSRAALLSRIDAIGTQNIEQLVVLQPGPRQRHGWVRRVPRLAWAGSTLVAAVLVIFVVSSVLMQDRIQEQQAELKDSHDRESRAVDVLLNQRYTTPLTSSAAAPNAQGKLLVNLADNIAMLLVRDMPAAAGETSYVVWLRFGDEYARIGPLELQEDWRGTLIVAPPDQLNRTTLWSLRSRTTRVRRCQPALRS